MWKRGELVWVSLNLSVTWIPGRILDPSDPFEFLVSFFGLMEPRYVLKRYLRSFERDFGTLMSDSRSLRRFVNRALRAHFWNISFGLWCHCQPPIDSPYFDRGNSLPWFPLTSNSTLDFIRDMAISQQVTIRRLAEINSSTAQVLSFRRYTVDFKRSESFYEEIRESVKLMNPSEEPDRFLDPSKNVNCINLVLAHQHSKNLSPSDPLPQDIPCSSSEQSVDKVVQVYTRTRNPLTISEFSILKACETMAQTSDHEDDSHPKNNRESCQVEQSICLLNLQPAIEDIIEEDSTNIYSPRVSVSAHDALICMDGKTVTSVKQLSALVDESKDNVFVAKPVSFVDPEACETLACSVKEETYAHPKNNPDSSMILNKEESSDMNTFYGTRENSWDDALESHDVEVGQVSLHITRSSNREFSSAEQLQDLNAAAMAENKTRAVDNVKSIGIKRKANRDKTSKYNSKRKKKVGKHSNSTDKPLNLHMYKDMRLADPKCLRMKFLSRHGNLPSEAELLKRFSMFGKIDASKIEVNSEESSAKVVFLQSIDAVTAYQFARSKKFTLGRSKVMFWLDPNSEVNEVSMFQKPQKFTPTVKSCLKEHGSINKEERRNLKVKFLMETN